MDFARKIWSTSSIVYLIDLCFLIMLILNISKNNVFWIIFNGHFDGSIWKTLFYKNLDCMSSLSKSDSATGNPIRAILTMLFPISKYFLFFLTNQMVIDSLKALNYVDSTTDSYSMNSSENFLNVQKISFVSSYWLF